MSLPLHNGLLQVFDVDHGQCAMLTMPNDFGGIYRVLIDCCVFQRSWTPISV